VAGSPALGGALECRPGQWGLRRNQPKRPTQKSSAAGGGVAGSPALGGALECRPGQRGFKFVQRERPTQKSTAAGGPVAGSPELVSLNSILSLSILYGVCHIKGVEGGVIYCAKVEQQYWSSLGKRQCAGVIRGYLILAHTKTSENISCIGQRAGRGARVQASSKGFKSIHQGINPRDPHRRAVLLGGPWQVAPR